MNPARFSGSPSQRFLITLLLGMLLTVSCEAPKAPAGPASQYADAQDAFKRGDYDRVLDITDEMAGVSASSAYAERARVLRSIIYSARIRSSLQLADAYAAGEKSTRNSRFKTRFEELRQDAATIAARTALDLGQTVHDLLKAGTQPQEFTLEASYPDVEGPAEIPQLERVKQGAWIEPDEQDAAALAARRKAVDDVLADALGGGRDKARAALAAGSAKIPGLDFTLFLTRQLLYGARALDRKHYNDFQKFKLIADEAEETAGKARDYLKAQPDKTKEKELKKLLDQIKEENRGMNL
jgi:hypothetical protein